MAQWQLQEAKNKFSEVVEKAIKDGPQIVTRRGVETVVIVSMDEYRDLTKPKTDIVDFFQKSPLKNANLDLSRIKDLPREVDI
ncbi:MAG TPA: type II toxin-antitoxin system Phd/YefM family antitoxin [Deltaproteobacteria bacterium]|nr:type II toxin-antitoxin system Phd/YefM family antitoxin [Deltaproteobacteria bacterium]